MIYYINTWNNFRYARYAFSYTTYAFSLDDCMSLSQWNSVQKKMWSVSALSCKPSYPAFSFHSIWAGFCLSIVRSVYICISASTWESLHMFTCGIPCHVLDGCVCLWMCLQVYALTLPQYKLCCCSETLVWWFVIGWRWTRLQRSLNMEEHSTPQQYISICI